MTEVTLTWAEAQQAALEGVRRRLRALANGRQHRHGYDGQDNWSVHIEAAGAEMAVAKAFHRFWAGSFEPDYDGDVGAGLQVRHTVRASGRLLLHPSDPDEHFYVLACGEIPRFEVVGGVYGHEAKRGEFWCELQAGRPCFALPRERLRWPRAS